MQNMELIGQFVEAMTQLTTILRDEVALVRARKFEALEGLQKRKVAQAKSYDILQARVKNNIKALDALSDSERAELRELYADFRDALSENMLVLKGTQEATDRVVKMIINSVKKARGVPDQAPVRGKPVTGYGAYANNSARSLMGVNGLA